LCALLQGLVLRSIQLAWIRRKGEKGVEREEREREREEIREMDM
jgi:hypothetical protein